MLRTNLLQKPQLQLELQVKICKTNIKDPVPDILRKKYNLTKIHLQRTQIYHSTIKLNDSIYNYFTSTIYETNLLKLP